MIRYDVWLQAALGAGNNKVRKIYEYFGSAKNVFDAGEKGRLDSKIFTQGELKRLNKTLISEAVKIIGDCNENGIEIIAFGSKKYPYCLSCISNPPVVLYVKGDMPDFDNTPSVCIVGPRKVSDFGKKSAYSLAFRLALSGITVVSGGALGCDTYVHAGALKSGGKTVLCLGCGIMADYLPENKELRKAVSKSGCLISEYPPNTPATKYSFPVRNRIMSGLTLGTVVIEASLKSGALITARHANEQGRDVFVVPAAPDRKESQGSNALLRDGAKPILDVSDIFNEYIVRFPDKINIEKAFSKSIISKKNTEKTEKVKENSKKLNITLSKEAKIVYNYLDKQKFYPEEIGNTGLTSQQILSALTELEMEFLIEAIPGGMYVKCDIT